GCSNVFVLVPLRLFQLQPLDLRPAVIACATLGQNPFAPPNVKGWPGGEAWINSSTLLGRKQLVEPMLLNDDRAGMNASMGEMGRAQATGKAREDRYRRMMERGLATY